MGRPRDLPGRGSGLPAESPGGVGPRSPHCARRATLTCGGSTTSGAAEAGLKGAMPPDSRRAASAGGSSAHRGALLGRGRERPGRAASAESPRGGGTLAAPGLAGFLRGRACRAGMLRDRTRPPRRRASERRGESPAGRVQSGAACERSGADPWSEAASRHAAPFRPTLRGPSARWLAGRLSLRTGARESPPRSRRGARRQTRAAPPPSPTPHLEQPVEGLSDEGEAHGALGDGQLAALVARGGPAELPQLLGHGQEESHGHQAGDEGGQGGDQVETLEEHLARLRRRRRRRLLERGRPPATPPPGTGAGCDGDFEGGRSGGVLKRATDGAAGGSGQAGRPGPRAQVQRICRCSHKKLS